MTRRELRHAILRARNQRVIAAGPDGWQPHLHASPVALALHPDDAAELRLDGDWAEAGALDFEGKAFMGVPITEDPQLERGTFTVTWPEG